MSDAPFEMMDTNDLPLSIEFDCSRILSSAGNSMLQQAIMPSTYLYSQELNDVLVVGSYESEDRIRNVFRTCLDLYDVNGSINYKYVTVTSAKEFIDAINNSSSKVMVYDGHAFYDKNGWVSYLKIGKDLLDVSRHKKKLNVPPIVLLSACDTLPIDGSHATAAHSFILAGAHTVLSTLTPVDAVLSARFFGRLLYRLQGDFLESYFKTNGAMITWSNLVTGLKRMEYFTDFLYYLFKKIKIDDHNLLKEVMFKTNVIVNSYQEDWLKYLLHMIAGSLSIDESSLHEELQVNFMYSEALSYIQLGNPDRIFILDERVVQ